MKVKVQKLDGSKVSGASGDIELNDAVFGVEPRADYASSNIDPCHHKVFFGYYFCFGCRCGRYASA